MNLKVTDKIILYLLNEFKNWEKTIKDATGSDIKFGKVAGTRCKFSFRNKSYEFGVKK